MNEILDDKHDDNDKRPVSRTIQNNSRGRQQKPHFEAIFHQGAMAELENENENAAVLDASNLDKGQSEARDANLMNPTPTNFSTLANATSISASIQNNSSDWQQLPQQPRHLGGLHRRARLVALQRGGFCWATTVGHRPFRHEGPRADIAQPHTPARTRTPTCTDMH